MAHIGRLLVANRGEIALRIIRACRKLGIESVLAVSSADRDSLPARIADRTVCIGAPSPAASYLSQSAMIAAGVGLKVDAVHPGYGFLAENAAFAESCAAAGLTFVGPRAEHIRRMGDKLEARSIAQAAGVPVLPATGRIRTVEKAKRAVDSIGFPVLIKAAAGGGGRGMRVVDNPLLLADALESAAAEAQAAFGDDSLYLERFVRRGRHVEVQVVGDADGRVVHVGERDCSVQRRYQKVVEEAPAPSLPDALRSALQRSAVELCTGINYVNAGTVEFIVDADSGEHYFLEMNTRIQVEHPVTEMISGIDLVNLQIEIAGGKPLDLAQDDIVLQGHAIECRITAESVEHGFRPDPGILTTWRPPNEAHVRLDSHCFASYRIPPYYDSLLGKAITVGRSRDEAIATMRAGLEQFDVAGVATNLPLLTYVMSHPEYTSGTVHTRWLEKEIPGFLSSPQERVASREPFAS